MQINIKTPDAPPLEHVIGDVKFFIKPHATAEDHLLIAFSRDTALFTETLVRRFVVAWAGVTDENGAVVPYSYEILAHKFPISKEQNPLIMLADFIWKNTDVRSLCCVEELKKK